MKGVPTVKYQIGNFQRGKACSRHPQTVVTPRRKLHTSYMAGIIGRCGREAPGETEVL